MTTPVTFELAKLLKEKGFNGKCKKYYNPDCNSVLIRNKTSILCKTYRIQAPTIATVIMWLYEEHGIWIEVRFLEAFKTFYFELTNVNNLKGITSKGENHFNSPSEAYSAAIEYTLNNLI